MAVRHSNGLGVSVKQLEPALALAHLVDATGAACNVVLDALSRVLVAGQELEFRGPDPADFPGVGDGGLDERSEVRYEGSDLRGGASDSQQGGLVGYGRELGHEILEVGSD